MHAKVSDKLHIHTSHTGAPDQYGRIVEIRGADGTPPYVVEFPDGHTRLIFPGPDAVVEPVQRGGHGGDHGARKTRKVHTRAGW